MFEYSIKIDQSHMFNSKIDSKGKIATTFSILCIVIHKAFANKAGPVKRSKNAFFDLMLVV